MIVTKGLESLQLYLSLLNEGKDGAERFPLQGCIVVNSCSLVLDGCFHPEHEVLDLGPKLLLRPVSLRDGTVLPIEEGHKLPALVCCLYDFIKFAINRGLKLRFPQP